MKRLLAWFLMPVLILLGACVSHGSLSGRRLDSASTLLELMCKNAKEAKESVSFQDFSLATGASTDTFERQARGTIQALESIGKEITDNRGFENRDFFYEMEGLVDQRDEGKWHEWLGRHDHLKTAVRALFAENASLVSATQDWGTCIVQIRSYRSRGLYRLTIRFTAGISYRDQPRGRGFWIGQCDGTEVAIDYDGTCCGSSVETGTMVFGRENAESPKFGIDRGEMSFVFN